MTTREMASIAGCTYPTILYWMEKYGIPRRRSGFNLVDEVGNRHGRLVVLERVDNTEKGHACWKCQCDCGNETIVTGLSLRSGNTKSCGCLKHDVAHESGERTAELQTIDETGNRFGRLVVLEIMPPSYGKGSYWLCECDCGELTIVSRSNLTGGHTRSCGCLAREASIESALRGPDSPHWKGGITPEGLRVRASPDYDRWRKGVLKRDEYECKLCANEKDLVVHHLNSFVDHPGERLDPANGIVLCEECHIAFHSEYGNGGNTKDQFAKFIESGG
jgi:hypothetical protein